MTIITRTQHTREVNERKENEPQRCDIFNDDCYNDWRWLFNAVLGRSQSYKQESQAVLGC